MSIEGPDDLEGLRRAGRAVGVKALRAERAMTQGELAKRLGSASTC